MATSSNSSSSNTVVSKATTFSAKALTATPPTGSPTAPKEIPTIATASEARPPNATTSVAGAEPFSLAPAPDTFFSAPVPGNKYRYLLQLHP